MKSEQVFRHIKLVLLGVTVAFVAQILFASQAYAQEAEPLTEFEKQVEAISDSIEQVGIAIATTRLKTSERIALFRQLIMLAESVRLLRDRNFDQDQGSRISYREEIDIDEVVFPEDVNLAHVAIDLEFETFIAKVTEYYHTSVPEIYSSSTESYQLTKNTGLSNDDFYNQVPWAKLKVAELLQEKLGIDSSLLERYLSISVRNPKRGTGTMTDRELEDQFILFSRIAAVSFSFRHRKSGDRDTDTIPYSVSLNLISDQGQSLNFDIVEDGTGKYRKIVNGIVSGNSSTQKKYDITYSLTDFQFQPTVDKDVSEVFRPDMVDYLSDFFVDEDFLSGIRGGAEKFTSFLTDNSGYLIVGRNGNGSFGSSLSSCIASSDAVVVDELMQRSIGHLGLASTFPKVPVSYFTPVVRVDDFRSPECRDVDRHF